MRSKRSRHRRRPPINWPVVIWGLFLFNVILGILYSPLTKARIVWVEGASLEQKPELIKVIQAVRGLPWPQVDKDKIQGAALELSPVASAEYSQNPFGRGILKLRQRKPVARIGTTTAYMDEIGGIYNLSTAPMGKVPVLILSPVFTLPTLSPVARWESGRIAKICAESSRKWPEMPLKLEVTERGVINLQPLTGGAMAILGSSDDWEIKLAALDHMVRSDPDLWRRYREINLIDPQSPMTRP